VTLSQRFATYTLKSFRHTIEGDQAEAIVSKYTYSGTPRDYGEICAWANTFSDFEVKILLQARSTAHPIGGKDPKKRLNALIKTVETEGYEGYGQTIYMFPHLLNNLVLVQRNPALTLTSLSSFKPATRNSQVPPPGWVGELSFNSNYVEMIESLPFLPFVVATHYIHVEKKINIPSSLAHKGWGGLVWAKALKKNAYEWLYNGFKGIEFAIDENSSEATLAMLVNPSYKPRDDSAPQAIKYLTVLKAKFTTDPETGESTVVKIVNGFCGCWAGTCASCHHICSVLLFWSELPRARCEVEMIASTNGKNTWIVIPSRADDEVKHRNPISMMPFDSCSTLNSERSTPKRKTGAITSQPTRHPTYFPLRAKKKQKTEQVTLPSFVHEAYATHHAQLKRDNGGHHAANADEWPTLLDAVNLSDCPILDLDNLSGKIGNEAYAKFMDLE
jgi:hypothetical protein